MYKPEIDIPVALIFFIRPTPLMEVFQQVRKARPSKIFLIQDGPRKNNMRDLEKIKECQKIVADIDWECEVYKNYSDINLGCGMRPFTGIEWVFNYVDRAIILEDDCVPAPTFFPYCKEMLEIYENDLRIGFISGLNHFTNFDFGGYSYGFSEIGAIGGWSTWKSRWQEYDFNMAKLDNRYIKENMESSILPKTIARKRLMTWESSKAKIDEAKDVSFWDYQWVFAMHLNSWLAIVPEHSQIRNIGIGIDSTHSGDSYDLLPKGIADFFFIELKNLDFPLKHPEFVLASRKYDREYYRRIYPNLFARLSEKRRRILKTLYCKLKFMKFR